MKTQILRAEGICGMQVTLNVADQRAITEMVDRLNAHFAAAAVHQEWSNKRDAERVWTWEKEAQAAWREENPEPPTIHIDFKEEMKTVLIFLKKLTLDSKMKATVFEEEDEKKDDDE